MCRAKLNTASFGEFQRILDQSITTCNTLHQEIVVYRRRLGEDFGDALS